MAILRARQVWKKEKPAGRGLRRLDYLTPDQVANVRAAMKVLAIRFGSIAGVARAMGTTRRTLEHMLGRAEKPSAGLAVHAARLAGVPVDDVLSRGVSEAGGRARCAGGVKPRGATSPR